MQGGCRSSFHIRMSVCLPPPHLQPSGLKLAEFMGEKEGTISDTSAPSVFGAACTMGADEGSRCQRLSSLRRQGDPSLPTPPFWMSRTPDSPPISRGRADPLHLPTHPWRQSRPLHSSPLHVIKPGLPQVRASLAHAGLLDGPW